MLPTGFVESRQYLEAQESNNNNLFKLNVSLGLNGNTERTFDVLVPGRKELLQSGAKCRYFIKGKLLSLSP